MVSKKCPKNKVLNPKTGRCINKPKSLKKKKCPEGKKLNPKTGRCINKPKTKSKSKSKKCPKGKVRNPKTGRCVNKPKPKSLKKKEVKKPPIFNKKTKKFMPYKEYFQKRGIGKLKSGELGKHGYHKVKDMSVKNRRQALTSAVNEYGASMIIKKLNALRVYQRNKGPESARLFYDDMRWVRKTFDDQFKGSWKDSALYKNSY